MYFGQSDGRPATLDLRRANRHGLIAGATGTGKTVTLHTLAENFSIAGVPVFLADVKGDLSGIAKPYDPKDAGYTVFWDLFGGQGHQVRTTVANMGPELMARMMSLTPVQEGVLYVAFAYAESIDHPLMTLADFRRLLVDMSENSKDISVRYGNVTTGSLGAIQRQLTMFEGQGGERFFGKPALDIFDMLRVTEAGRGQINVLAADTLIESPRLYSTFLLWLLAELFRRLPEVGDPDKPKLVFFFDEAHLLFDGNKKLEQTIERVVRLIRSKGVGVYFVTQSPMDVPEAILGQLGNRFQHALRAFTAKDQRAVKMAASTFRDNPTFDTSEVITTLGIGEALVSTLQPDGSPSIVERVKVDLPLSQLGPITDEDRAAINEASLYTKYDTAIVSDELEVAVSPASSINWFKVLGWVLVLCAISPVAGCIIVAYRVINGV